MTPAERKTDTRRKIQLGGLIVKAGCGWTIWADATAGG